MNTYETDVVMNPVGSAKNGKPVIEIRNLRKSFGSLEILKDISLQLNQGENLVVLGKSGTGKSVLIKCIVGLLRFDGGEINVFGSDISTLSRQEMNNLKTKIGFLFQSGALYDSMSVKQNLEFPLKRLKKNLREKEMNIKIEEALENVGLANALHKMPSELSGGMRKRISLARTLVVDPMIMLYDEPTTGLDPVTSDEISALIKEVQMKYKTSSIIITHDIRCALTTADRIVMLDSGEVYQEGPLEHFTNSQDKLIQSFFVG
jgi:phospholipid/cholesterol/gamma-HCH transport system ATP-binding protein